jgi:hypothetical protein
MRISKISSASTLLKNPLKKQDRPPLEDPENSKKPLDVMVLDDGVEFPLDELNVFLAQNNFPYRLVLESNSVFYMCISSGDILGVLDEQYITNLLDDVRLIQADKLRKLTYEKSNTTGNFLNLDI